MSSKLNNGDEKKPALHVCSTGLLVPAPLFGHWLVAGLGVVDPEQEGGKKLGDLGPYDNWAGDMHVYFERAAAGDCPSDLLTFGTCLSQDVLHFFMAKLHDTYATSLRYLATTGRSTVPLSAHIS